MSWIRYGDDLIVGTADSILTVEQIPNIVVPGKRIQQIQIPGRDGLLLVDEGTYDNIIKKYNVYLNKDKAPYAETTIQAASVALEQFFLLKGYQKLQDGYTMNLVSSAYWMAELKSNISIVNIFQRFGRCTLEFNCKPGIYSEAIYSFARNSLVGAKIPCCGSIKGTPIIEFINPNGQVSISINDTVAGTYILNVVFPTEIDKATLDTERMMFTAYSSSLDVNLNLFPYINITHFGFPPLIGQQLMPYQFGDWEIVSASIDGTLDSIIINPKWRSLM